MHSADTLLATLQVGLHHLQGHISIKVAYNQRLYAAWEALTIIGTNRQLHGKPPAVNTASNDKQRQLTL